MLEPTDTWTLDRAITFARDLVNHENPKFRSIGMKMLSLKDENLLRACEMVEQFTGALCASPTPKSDA